MRRGFVVAGILVAATACDGLTGPSAGPPAITSVSPAVLTPGDTATIDGANFSARAAGNEVTVAGLAAQVVAASATRIRAVVPPAGSLPCAGQSGQPVVVVVGGREAVVEHPFTAAAQRSLAVGESIWFDAAAAGCNELTDGGAYLVSVFNTSQAPGSRTSFMLRGTSPVAADAAVAPRLHRVEPGPMLGALAPERGPDREALGHARILEQNVRIARELAPRVTPRRPSAGPALSLAPLALGATREFNVPDVDSGSYCTDPFPVTARLVYSGQTALIWEDQAAPLAGQMDGRWEEVGREYEEVMHPILLEKFGDPLAYDPWLDNPGRVNMLFSEQVNDFRLGVAGFVFSGDLYPTDSCAASNQAAIFYGRVPTEAGSGYDGHTVDTWAWRTRSTIIHEVKHIISYATRMRLAAESGGSPVFEALWLEEATARLSEEFYARALMGYGQGDNVSYAESIWCERRVGSAHPTCDAVPSMMYKHFGAVYQYYRNVGDRTPIGQANSGDFTFYGSGWLLVRWALDQSGRSEAAFSRALVHEPQLTGVSNLVARAGRAYAELLADFSLALAVDGHPGGLATRPELQIPSWNTRDIMAGLHEDHQGTGLAHSYPVPWPLATSSLGPGDFETTGASVRGGTAAFFEIGSPAEGGQLLQLLSAGGDVAPGNLGVAIVRIE